MIVLAKARKFGLTCRCGIRSVWRIPTDIVEAIQQDSPIDVEYRYTKQENGMTLLKIEEIYFECRCKRVFMFTKDGIRNVTDERNTQPMFDMTKTIPSSMGSC